MNLRTWIMGASMSTLLISCATTYQKSGTTGGYSERKISDSAYEVTFGGNGYASKDRIYYFWLYRCAELTLQEGYKLYLIRAIPSQAVNPAVDVTVRPAVATDVDKASFVKARGGGGVILVPGVGSGATKYTYRATVLMYKQPLPQEVLWAVDAERTIAALKSYVTSNGSVTPPSRSDLFRRVFVAHAQISIGDDSAAAVYDSAAASGDAPTPPLTLRTVDSIADTLSASQMVAFHAVYRAYVAQAKPASSGGDVVLEFTVTPNGQVSDCHVLSSSFKDTRLGGVMASLVSRTEFGPLSVAQTRVSHFRITFVDELANGGSNGM